MQVTFELADKEFINEKGEVIKYKVLRRKLLDGTFFEISFKNIKDSKLLLMSLALENKLKKGD